MQVIIHHRKPTDRHCEDLCKFLQPLLDPLFAVERSLPQQKGAAHAAGHAVIPTRQGGIDYQLARSPWMLSPGVICRCYQNCPCESICSACLFSFLLCAGAPVLPAGSLFVICHRSGADRGQQRDHFSLDTTVAIRIFLTTRTFSAIADLPRTPPCYVRSYTYRFLASFCRQCNLTAVFTFVIRRVIL